MMSFIILYFSAFIYKRTLVVWSEGGDFCGKSMSEKAPQERSDEETEAMPAKSVRRSGNQRVHIDTSILKEKRL